MKGYKKMTKSDLIKLLENVSDDTHIVLREYSEKKGKTLYYYLSPDFGVTHPEFLCLGRQWDFAVVENLQDFAHEQQFQVENISRKHREY